MCGRYYFSFDDLPTSHELRKRVVQQHLFDFRQQEVFPSMKALVLTVGETYTPALMKWGIRSYKGNLIINARSEGIEQKKTFAGMLSRRCLIPCNGFFEWKAKKKIYVQQKMTSVFYLGGIYNEQQEFVIVTGDAENEMRNIHHRTPIILKEQDIEKYLAGQLPFFVDNEHLSFQLAERS